LELPVAQVHFPVQPVQMGVRQLVAIQLVQNSELVQILELGESRLLVHQLRALWLLLELLNLVLLVNMF